MSYIGGTFSLVNATTRRELDKDHAVVPVVYLVTKGNGSLSNVSLEETVLGFRSQKRSGA